MKAELELKNFAKFKIYIQFCEKKRKIEFLLKCMIIVAIPNEFGLDNICLKF